MKKYHHKKSVIGADQDFKIIYDLSNIKIIKQLRFAPTET